MPLLHVPFIPKIKNKKKRKPTVFICLLREPSTHNPIPSIHFPNMDSIAAVSPSMALPLRCRSHLPSSSSWSRVSWRRRRQGHVALTCQLRSGPPPKPEEDGEDREVERALHMDGTIPGTFNEFVERVSSRAYDMRRHLQQSFDSSSYDVLEANPWRDTSKPVYVLTQRENQLCTMKTRRARSEVERELRLLFAKGGKRWSDRQSRTGTKFQMLVEDIREGVLVFEDANEAVRYCDLLQGGGQGCEGVAEIEASSVFDLCRNMRALAVLLRRGRTHPLPKSLELNLRARKRSLEDQDDLV